MSGGGETQSMTSLHQEKRDEDCLKTSLRSYYKFVIKRKKKNYKRAKGYLSNRGMCKVTLMKNK
jgi:hypothetical protein